MRLKGRGLPSAAGSSVVGDQLVVIQIVTPPAESDEDKAFYNEMEKKFDWSPR